MAARCSIVVNMKLATLSVVAFVMLAMAGCSLGYHRKTFNDGFDFPNENVDLIVNGKTTGDEIIEMFGGPLQKIEVSESEEHWRYFYSTGFEIKESGFLTDETQSSRWHKTLVIVLKHGVVTNFTYTEGH
jgi:outer membrane protein assembly factor BamE (lipoprotein component of BamABCDE complex)